MHFKRDSRISDWYNYVIVSYVTTVYLGMYNLYHILLILHLYCFHLEVQKNLSILRGGRKKQQEQMFRSIHTMFSSGGEPNLRNKKVRRLLRFATIRSYSTSAVQIKHVHSWRRSNRRKLNSITYADEPITCTCTYVRCVLVLCCLIH